MKIIFVYVYAWIRVVSITLLLIVEAAKNAKEKLMVVCFKL